MAKTSSSGKKFDPAAITEHLIPHTHNQYDLGSTAAKWRYLYAVAIVATLITATTLTATGINVSYLNATYLNASMDGQDYNITNLGWVDASTGNFTNWYISNKGCFVANCSSYIWRNSTGAVVIHAE